MQYDENDFSFETLSNTFKNLYKNDSTLDYLTKFEEDRKQLLGLSKNSLLFQEQEIIMELEASKSSTETIKIVLGKLLTRSAEIGSIGSLVISILGLL